MLAKCHFANSFSLLSPNVPTNSFPNKSTCSPAPFGIVLPIDLEICIPKEDFVFKVAEICESLDYSELYATYVRVWRKVNPITMFEILVFGYIEHLYSGRDIAKACKTDIRFMWLLNGEPAPSHATISRFQDERLKEVMEGLFYQFVEKLYEMKEIEFKYLFVDGTKNEANANRYTFVWKKAINKNLEKLNEKRAKQGLPPEKLNEKAIRAAQVKPVDEKALAEKRAKNQERMKESTAYYNED